MFCSSKRLQCRKQHIQEPNIQIKTIKGSTATHSLPHFVRVHTDLKLDCQGCSRGTCSPLTLSVHVLDALGIKPALCSSLAAWRCCRGHQVWGSAGDLALSLPARGHSSPLLHACVGKATAHPRGILLWYQFVMSFTKTTKFSFFCQEGK